ncbi:MAG TPA: electron transfer flavoprotein subunit beta/FixA family protein [Syntrophorhabdaceae bacterium]|nr:electron transfer flavoprotein subunit beta/FixA family protein [Syntrophorhabdaceae bacterium]
MNILVFIKQVADTEARILIKGDSKSLEIENKYNLNFFDEFAVEEAIRLKTKLKESKIVVCTCGGKKAIEALRTAIAMGADEAHLIDNADMETEDPLITARVLAGFAKKEGFDIILCGRQAIDDENGAIGPMVAELLNIPHISAITKLDVKDERHMIVESDVEGGKNTFEVELPALFTTQKGINEPRVPLITGVMKAMKANIPVIEPETLGLQKEELSGSASKIEILSYETPKARPPVKIIEGETPQEKAKKLIKLLKEEAKVL